MTALPATHLPPINAALLPAEATARGLQVA